MLPWVQGVLRRPHSCQLLERKAQGLQHLQKHGLGRSQGGTRHRLPGRQALREFIRGCSHGHPLPGTKAPVAEQEQVCSAHLTVVQTVETPT